MKDAGARGRASWPLTLGLWALLAARFVPAILYVRARLAALHGRKESCRPSHVAHASALALVAALAYARALPLLAVVVTALLLARSLYGFARGWPSTAKRVGFAEIAFGALTVAAVAVGVIFAL